MYRVHLKSMHWEGLWWHIDLWSPCPFYDPVTEHESFTACRNPKRTQKPTYVEVGCRPHLPVFGNDIDDERIAHQSDQHDEGEEEGDQPGVREEGVLLCVLLIITPVSSQREVCLWAIDPGLLCGVPGLLRGVHFDWMRMRFVREVKSRGAEEGEWSVRDKEDWVSVRRQNVFLWI